MVVTMTGTNSYGLTEALRGLIATFVAEYGELGLERLDGQEADIANLSEALTSLPFLSTKKMIVLRYPSTNKKFVEQFEQILSQVPESTEVILVEPKLDKRLSYYKYLKSKTDFREFPDLDINELSRWLAQTAKDRGGDLSLTDARYLVERAGMNQQLLASEIEKLLLYNPKISRRSIDLLVEPVSQSTVFQLLEAAFAGNSKRAMELYAEQRAQKVEPQQIVAMLAWQLHALAVIKTAGERDMNQIATEARLNPFVVRKSQSIARSLSRSELQELIANLLKIDMDSKSLNIDSDEALQLYLLSLGRA